MTVPTLSEDEAKRAGSLVSTFGVTAPASENRSSVTDTSADHLVRASTRIGRLASLRADAEAENRRIDEECARIRKLAVEYGDDRMAAAAMLLNPRHTSAEALLVKEAVWSARWCAQCGRDLAPDEPVVRTRRSLDPWAYWDLGRVAPCCLTCAAPFVGGATCAGCGRPVFDTTARARVQPFCSEYCRRRAVTRRRREEREAARQRRCRTCGQGFAATRRDAQHCSAACRQRAYRLRMAGTS